MIHYQLRCAQDHGFDGWFKDSAAFEAQADRGLVACPVCGETKVNRALMAPKVARRRETVDQSGQAQAERQPETQAVMPDAMRAALQRLRAEVEKRCDYVGSDFAEEARRMHRGESERAGIYGEATPDQAEALAEEGVQVARIPWLPRADG
jgi:hypothetical protein